jgi:hypothetical protein
MVLVTQYFDTMKEIGASSKSSSVFIPHGPGASPICTEMALLLCCRVVIIYKWETMIRGIGVLYACRLLKLW